MQKNTCILLTGTIAPNSTFVERSAIEQRLTDYKNAISFYLKNLKEDIVFIENSDFPVREDVDFLEFNKSGRFRMIRMKPLENNLQGKGFQEFYMLDNAIDQLADQYNRFVKITGRYIVENVTDLLKCKSELCMDFHKKMKVGITGFFIVDLSFYRENIKGIYTNADDSRGIFIEHVIYKHIFNSNVTDAISIFPVNPKYKGISGSSGASLRRNPYKLKLRNLERKVLRLFNLKQFLIEY